MVDIDQVALEAARQLTAANDVQGRATMQCAIIAALRRALPAKPEAVRLREDGLWSIRLMGPDDIHAAPSKAQALEVANAINREFAGSQIKPYAVVVRWTGSPEQHAESLADWEGQWEQGNGLVSSAPQQVGEVQGDALVPVEPRALAASIAELEALMEGECLDPLTTSESESAMLVLHELKRLQLVAARQPGAQEEVTDAEVEKAWSRFEAALQAPDGDTPEDRVLSQTIDQRDRYHEVADDLAAHIERITGVEIGEHSSVNCPWQNAIEAAECYSPAQGIEMGPGVQAIAIERQRQMATERFTSTHDEQYQRGELAKAAVAYAQLAATELEAGTRGHIGWLNPPAIWPWEAHWWKPVDARRDLVRAGALIAAQIDLIDQRDAAPGVGNG